MQDNSRTATILLSVLLLLLAIGFSIGLGYLVRGWASNGSNNFAAVGAGLNGSLTGFYNPQNCSEGQYSRWNGNAWICANDLVGGARGPQGPQGPQGIQGPPGISYSGGGSILTYGTTPQTCYSGQYSRWNGSYWVCETDRVGSGGGYDNGYYERPIACSSGQYSRYTGSYWTCETDRIGSGGGSGGNNYYAGTGLTLNGDTFSLTGLQACSSGQYSRWTGSQWVCANDQTTGGGGGGNSGASVGYGGTPSDSNFIAGGNNSGGSALLPGNRQNFTVSCPQNQVLTGLTLTDSGDGANHAYRVKGVICVPLKNL